MRQAHDCDTIPSFLADGSVDTPFDQNELRSYFELNNMVNGVHKGFEKRLTEQEFVDLIAFLVSQKDRTPPLPGRAP